MLLTSRRGNDLTQLKPPLLFVVVWSLFMMSAVLGHAECYDIDANLGNRPISEVCTVDTCFQFQMSEGCNLQGSTYARFDTVLGPVSSECDRAELDAGNQSELSCRLDFGFDHDGLMDGLLACENVNSKSETIDGCSYLGLPDSGFFTRYPTILFS